MASVTTRAIRAPGEESGRTAQTRPGDSLGWSLVAVAGLTCLLVATFPGVLRGTDVMNGSALGTALVVLAVAAPLLAGSLVLGSRNHPRAMPIRLGCQAYLLYNALLFVFATPFDDLFLGYVAWLAVALWSLLFTLAFLDASRFAASFGARVPIRSLGAYVLVVVVLNALAWLRPVVSAMTTDDAPAFLAGTGLTTNPIYVQDLAFWLPAMAVGAVWLWRRMPWGYVIVSGGLVFWVIESLGIAVDQWLGEAADPASPAASSAVTVPFLVLALIGTVPALVMLAHLPPGPSVFGVSPVHPGARWPLVSSQLFVAAMATWGGLRLIADGFEMPLSWLEGTGFDEWTLPGLFLLLCVVLPQAVAAGLVLLRHPAGVVVSWVAAIGLVLWIVVQLAVLRQFFFLQPVGALIGLLQLAILVVWRGLPARRDERSGRHAVAQVDDPVREPLLVHQAEVEA